MAAWYCWCLLIHLAVTDSGVLYWNISLSTRNTSLKKSGFCQNVSSCTNMNIIAVSSIISSSFLRLSDYSVLPCWWAVLLNEREKIIQLAKVHGNHIKNGKCPKIMVWHQPKQCTIDWTSLKTTIDLHWFDSPKSGSHLMTPDVSIRRKKKEMAL